jgi:GNAT superfamily N-acetyltransferase
VVTRCDGNIVGYCVAFVRPHLKNFGLLAAWKDMIYVAPTFRGYGIAAMMMDKAVDECRARGAQLMFAQDKVRRGNLDNLLTNRGFRPYQTQYVKVL